MTLSLMKHYDERRRYSECRVRLRVESRRQGPREGWRRLRINPEYFDESRTHSIGASCFAQVGVG